MKKTKISCFVLALPFLLIFPGTLAAAEDATAGACANVRAGVPNPIDDLGQAEAIAACQRAAAPGEIDTAFGDEWTLYTTQYPTEHLDARPDGWESAPNSPAPCAPR